MEHEEWKDILYMNKPSGYKISSIGRIGNNKGKNGSWRILKPQMCLGYVQYRIHLGDSSYFVARANRLVAYAFIPNPNNYPVAMHKNNIKTDNRVENLKWGTHSDNSKDAHKDGLVNYKPLRCRINMGDFTNKKLTKKQVIAIFNSKENRIILEKRYNISQSAITCIKNGKTWGWLTGKVWDGPVYMKIIKNQEVFPVKVD